MVFNTNLGEWFRGGTRYRELEETRESWNRTEALWRASPLGKGELGDIVLGIVREATDQAERIPSLPILDALCDATEDILRAEDVAALEALWPTIESDAAVAVEFRQMLRRRARWAEHFDQMHGIVKRQLHTAFASLFSALPETCFGEWNEEDEESFGVPLIELLDHPAEVIERILVSAYDDDTLRLDVFLKLRLAYDRNLVVASGFPPSASTVDHQDRLVIPTRQKGKSASELAELYLAGTPFMQVMELPVPFHIPEEVRFEHCHIVGGTGHGKTQLMQRMIHADLVAAQREKRSVVVIDSQGDLINKLVRLSLFSPDEPDSLADRLVLIDPADVEFPAALNLFDAHLARLEGYRPVDQERVLNGVIELYEVFFSSLLGAELTQKQGVIFKYLARLMLAIPGATIHTLMALMEDGRPFKRYMELLDGSGRYFFEKEFFDPSFSATKKQILKRLWGVLSTPAFERMFAQKDNKLDLFDALNDGKIILINTAKDLLKQEGSQLFGRFFISMIAQAALERSTLPEHHRTPTTVYVDEAQEYFDDSIETILNQARKYRVGLTLAHQTLDQLTPRLRSAILSNTSLKCAGGVSAKDARLLADEFHTSTDFIEGMKRRKDRTEFAVWLKHHTPQAIRLTAPLGFLERQPIATEEAFQALMEANRSRYCGTWEEVQEAMRTARESVTRESEATARAVERASTTPERPTDEAPVAGPEPSTTSSAEPVRAGQPSMSELPPVRPEPPRPPRRPAEEREQGKGGTQHKYMQHLVKQLAEERGFRAVVEEAVDGGHVDVGLHRDDITIACEISVTSTAEYEAQNLAKCLRAGFHRIWAIAPDQKRRRAIKAAAEARLGSENVAKIEFLTPEDIVFYMDGLAVPEPEETVVRGYKVKVTRRVLPPEEAAEKRATIARILAQSIRGSGR